MSCKFLLFWQLVVLPKSLAFTLGSNSDPHRKTLTQGRIYASSQKGAENGDLQLRGVGSGCICLRTQQRAYLHHMAMGEARLASW